MEFERFKKILSVILINVGSMIGILISAYYPYIKSLTTSFIEYGWGRLYFGGWEGLVIIFIATLFIFFYRLKFALVFQVIGTISIFFNIVIDTLILFIRSSDFIMGVGKIILLFPFVGIVTNIPLLFRKQYLEKEVADEKFQRMIKIIPEDVDLKTRLFGMIKVEKEFNLKTAQNMLNIPKTEIKELIYDLVGERKLDGEFQDDIFLISSDIDEFLTVLDASFQQWEGKVQSKEKII